MNKRILIADDSASMRQLVSFALRDAGFEVIESINGRDALSKMDGTKIDLIVTDLNMPEMDGIELIRQVRRKPCYRFIPVIMLTTESQESKKQEGKQAGASGWIVKPFTPEQLVETVKRFAR